MEKRQMLEGMVFGRLTVIERAGSGKYRERLWKCVCECGATKNIAGYLLINGDISSCGCFRNEQTSKRSLKDMTGQKFGKLTVLERHGVGRNNLATWKCRCDCGNDNVIVIGAYLREGGTKSCGCLHREVVASPYGESTMKHIICDHRCQSRKRKILDTLTDDELYALYKGNCYYCGAPPSQIVKSRSNNGDYVYNGIDRVDNSIGYISGNVVSCCGICNEMKMDRTYDGFLLHVIDIYNHMDLHKLNSIQ